MKTGAAQHTLTAAGHGAALLMGAVVAVWMSGAFEPTAASSPLPSQPAAATSFQASPAVLPAEAPGSNKTPTGLRLVGVAAWTRDGQRVSRALIEHAQSAQWHESGHPVRDGWVLAEVAADAAVLRQGTQVLKLPLEAASASGGVPPVPHPTRVLLAPPRAPTPPPADTADLPDYGD